MEVLRELTKKPKPMDSMAIGFFVVATLYAFLQQNTLPLLAAVGVFLIIVGLYPKQSMVAFLVSASVILLLQRSMQGEGFANPEKKPATSGAAPDHDATDEQDEPDMEEKREPVGPSDEEKEEEQKHAEAFAPTASKKVMLPDNADRREPLVLGKKYTLPSEKDDDGYHMDAGTTFLNAYKALKPDQIAAMTRDTQELLATQKSLVGMLDSFAPLLKDMNKITGFFGGS
jgi:hypothetical protein